MPTRYLPGRLLALLLLGAALAVAACGSSGASAAASAAASVAAPSVTAPSESASAASSAGASPASSAGGGGNAVTIKDFSFAPGTLSVAVGTTVTWTNQDSTSHTVTADDGSFDSKPIANGATFTQTFTKAGTFAYHCSIHPSMTATVEVK